MRSYEEFHGIVVERIDKLTNLLNYLNALSSDSTKLKLEKDRVKELINPQKRIRKKHLNCLDNVEAANEKIQKVEEEMKLICSNTQGLIKIINKLTGAPKERRNEGTLQETSPLKSIIPQSLIMGLGNIGDSGAVLPQDSVFNFKYRNFQINCYDSNTEHCRSSQSSHRPKRAKVKSVGMDSTCGSSSIYAPLSNAALGTISVFGFSAEASSSYCMAETMTIRVSGMHTRGHECFYGLGAIRYTGSGQHEEYGYGDGCIPRLGTGNFKFLGQWKVDSRKDGGAALGMHIFASKDIIGLPCGALLICTDGIDSSNVLLDNSCIDVGALRINAGGGNTSIVLQDNQICNGDLFARIDASYFTMLFFIHNIMSGRKLHFRIGGSGSAKVLLDGNDIRNGDLHMQIDGNSDTDILIQKNDIRFAKLYIRIDGNGDTKVRLTDNNICGGEVCIMIGGTGDTKILLSKNVIRRGALRVKINGTGNTSVLLSGNDICGGALRIKIDGPGNGNVEVRKE